MNAYQNFLDFFSMHNKERLDGLSEIYFDPMTPDERKMAFDYLLKKVQAGGTEESVNGLFLADEKRAATIIDGLLKNNNLRDEAEISAAWNLYRRNPDSELLIFFIRSMSNADERIRAKAAYYIPAEKSYPEVISALKGMIRTETDLLASINATNKLLECYGITRESVPKEEFSKLYKGLRNEDTHIKESALKKLDLYKVLQ